MRRAAAGIAAIILWPALAGAASPSCRIAIDVGHDRALPGATSARGRPEWEFNIALARRFDAALTKAGIPHVLMNPDGATISLADRPARAETENASLLIALHHDSVQPKYLSNWQWGGMTRQFSDDFHGFGLFVSAKNPEFEASQAVAKDIADGLLAAALTPSLHHAEPIAGEDRPLLDAARGIYRYDDLVVLKRSSMPAVLVEAGVIVNRDEELTVEMPAYQDKIAAALTAAASRHCAAREIGVRAP
jgi:N-acetylmuramoyl-L-alanine amidase